jgi:hypothetical protein
MAQLNYLVARAEDGGITRGATVTFQYDSVTLKIASVTAVVAGAGTVCHLHLDDSASGLVFDQDCLPNPDGSPKTTVIPVPNNASKFYTFTTNAKGIQVFDLTSTTMRYTVDWP